MYLSIGTFHFQLSFRYREYFLAALLEYCVSESGEVRQAACYGVGVMAQFGGPEYVQACTGNNNVYIPVYGCCFLFA